MLRIINRDYPPSYPTRTRPADVGAYCAGACGREMTPRVEGVALVVTSTPLRLGYPCDVKPVG